MTIRNLDLLLHPKSVALIGGSSRPGSVGQVVLRNVLEGQFAGPIYAVNPRRVDVEGVIWASSIEELPAIPDLAIIMTPAHSVPDIIGRLGQVGTKTAVVISSDVTRSNGLRQAMLEAAKPHLLRIVGPNCLGILAPHAKLNASFARTNAAPGQVALLSQSGALVTAFLDWAAARAIGFSGIVSAGDMADVDLGDLIDLYARDPATGAILIYLEGVTHPAKFMSAARAAARIKPVIAIKAGRSEAADKAAMSHTGMLAGSYDVYACALRRAGIVMVDTLTELFDAAEILQNGLRTFGDRLAIVTNGGGAGILAVDALGEAGGTLAALSADTMSALDRLLPAGWSHGDPVDIIGDASADRYRAAIEIVLRDEAVDALLVMNCPTALASPLDIAGVVAEVVAAARSEGLRKPVLACWLGDANSAEARQGFAGAQIPLFATPDAAVRGFNHLVAAKRARDALMSAPAAHREIDADREAARDILTQVRAEGRTWLNEIESKALLARYGIPVVPTELARTVDAVADCCSRLAAPYVVKIVSPQITHKSDVGGVALDLPDMAAAVAAARAMGERIAREHPEASITGFAVGTMCRRPNAHELIAGIADDATFGPLVMMGAGGTAVEVLRDKALELPPLDDGLARAMIARTRISRLLAGYRNEPAVDLGGVTMVLHALSTLSIDLPDICELDINPLLIDAQGVVALDARVRITAEADPPSRLVIRPIPMEWAADLETRSGLRFHVRPVRPDDEAALAEFYTHVTLEDLRFRFLTGLRVVGHDRLAAMTQIDYRRDMTFLAFGEDGKSVIACAMLAADPDHVRAEVAISVHADSKNRGLSWTLLDHVLRYAQAEGISIVESVESADNDAAIRLECEMGFTAMACPGDPTLRIVRRVLRPLATSAG